jgi:endonuclease/exonuclease/phosphatase family metal-dependent hydrolase
MKSTGLAVFKTNRFSKPVSLYYYKIFSKHLLIALMFLGSFNGLKAQQLKVIAYNVEFAKNTSPKDMASLLSSENADIICFNEVPAQGWTKKVGELLGLNYSYEGGIASAHHTDKFKDKTGNYFGKYKSILSKYPLKDEHEINLEGVGWSPATAVISTVVVNKNISIQVFSLHIPTGISDPINSKAAFLSKVLKTSYLTFDKIILAGDFNDLHDSQPLEYLYEVGFLNSWKASGVNLTENTTYLNSTSKNGYVIDHIISKGLKPVDASIIEEQAPPQSDHKPVSAIFKL